MLNLNQLRRLEVNLHQLRAIEQNLNALFDESGATELRRAVESVERAMDYLHEAVEVREVA